MEHLISDIAVRISLVAAGVGWIPARAPSAEFIVASTPGLVFRELADPPIPLPRLIVWRKIERSTTVANFVSFAREFRASGHGNRPGTGAHAARKIG